MSKTLDDVAVELARARAMNKKFTSPHHGWAVIFEEVDELWDEVKRKRVDRSKAAMRKEAIQIAAMAVRFVEDICEVEG